MSADSLGSLSPLDRGFPLIGYFRVGGDGYHVKSTGIESGTLHTLSHLISGMPYGNTISILEMDKLGA